MNAFTVEEVFPLREHAGAHALLFVPADAVAAETRLLDALSQLPEGGLLVLDCSGVRLASAGARQLLRRALLRLSRGELEDRYLVLAGLGDSVYNVDVMLKGERLAVVERTVSEGPVVRGQLDASLRDTYTWLLARESGTASALRSESGLGTIAAATNRLTSLWRQALARRVGRRAAEGGGREYLYAAVQ